ncbi:mitogen-activated protein kinase 15 isoform X5 [Sturnira hondurensis]|uniref:mitogen-activated protein kinase 15 isoform X5 n=1 Tax=Sturnira hondurensis TaxID=192404 RepID=UPI001879699D|nr:mitogen-activated protein kinase 15 isoform X5 [Sturnira hondurensis]
MNAAEVDPHVAQRYLLKRRLGKGAYGVVWKAVDRRTGEVVAIKKILDAFRDKTDAQRTFREIVLLQVSGQGIRPFSQEFGDHPNIVRLLDVVRAENDKDIYLVFESMDTDLNAVICKGGLLQDIHRRYIFHQLLRATKFIHSGGVVHRDQKVHPWGGYVEPGLHPGRDAAGEAPVPGQVYTPPAGANTPDHPVTIQGGPPGSGLGPQCLDPAPRGGSTSAGAGGPPAGRHAPGGPGSPRETSGVRPGQAAYCNPGTAAPLRAQVPLPSPGVVAGGTRSAAGARRSPAHRRRVPKPPLPDDPCRAENVPRQRSDPLSQSSPPGGPGRGAKPPGATMESPSAPRWVKPRVQGAAPSLTSQANAQVAIQALIRSDPDRGRGPKLAGLRQVSLPPPGEVRLEPRPGRRMFRASALQGVQGAARAALGGYSQAYGTVCHSALGRLPLPPGPHA